jgi:hypothetical protein
MLLVVKSQPNPLLFLLQFLLLAHVTMSDMLESSVLMDPMLGFKFLKSSFKMKTELTSPRENPPQAVQTGLEPPLLMLSMEMKELDLTPINSTPTLPITPGGWLT